MVNGPNFDVDKSEIYDYSKGAFRFFFRPICTFVYLFGLNQSERVDLYCSRFKHVKYEILYNFIYLFFIFIWIQIWPYKVCKCCMFCNVITHALLLFQLLKNTSNINANYLRVFLNAFGVFLNDFWVILKERMKKMAASSYRIMLDI